MYVDFMINDSLQPDAMQIFLQKTLKFSALISIWAPKQIKDSLLTPSFQEVQTKLKVLTPTMAGFETLWICHVLSAVTPSTPYS